MTSFYDKSLLNLSLPKNDIEKYKRQLVLEDCTVERQRDLFERKILVVGCGGLGIPVVLYLVGAGCRNIGIMDGDKIEISNLHRQVVYNIEDIGHFKSDILAEKAKKMNEDVKVDVYREFFTEDKIAVIDEYDIIVDCSDNIQTRYLLNDNTINKIFICASVLRWHGEIYIFSPYDTCYRCLYPRIKKNPDTCNSSGIIGSVCGIIGSMVSLEVIKSIFFDSKSKMFIYDSKQNKLTEIKMRSIQKSCATHIKLNNSIEACSTDLSLQELKKPLVQQDVNLNYKSHVDIDEKIIICWEEYFQKRQKYDLIDIRTSKLYELAHIRDSRNIPIKTFSRDKLGDKTPVFLCSRGQSAQIVAKDLLDQKIDCRVLKDGFWGFKRDIDSEFPL